MVCNIIIIIIIIITPTDAYTPLVLVVGGYTYYTDENLV